LRAALDSGQLAGAALDVFAEEPPPPGSIATHPKVIATPHIGAQTAEAQIRAGTAIAEEVLAVLYGREPRFRVLAND
jgi:D-3-phosphoglycerate dehydrogenase